MLLGIALTVAALVAIMIYFIPTMVANSRYHRNAGAIMMVNLLLGWTFIGWVIALVWAMTADVKEPSARKYRVHYM